MGDYTEIQQIDSVHRISLKIKHQSFLLDYKPDDKEDAVWMQGRLDEAINTLIESVIKDIQTDNLRIGE